MMTLLCAFLAGCGNTVDSTEDLFELFSHEGFTIE